VSDPAIINDIRVVDSTAISDHCLIVASLQSCRPPPPVIQFASRNLRRLNHAELETRLRDSALFMNPASTADGFAAQLQSVVTDCLDKLVPLKTMRRRVSKSSAKWLSAVIYCGYTVRSGSPLKPSPLSADVVDSNANVIEVRMTALLTVPPAVMQMYSSTSRERITCGLKLKPVPIPVNVGR
jgi:hypothetical protein